MDPDGPLHAIAKSTVRLESSLGWSWSVSSPVTSGRYWLSALRPSSARTVRPRRYPFAHGSAVRPFRAAPDVGGRPARNRIEDARADCFSQRYFRSTARLWPRTEVARVFPRRSTSFRDVQALRGPGPRSESAGQLLRGPPRAGPPGRVRGREADRSEAASDPILGESVVHQPSTPREASPSFVVPGSSGSRSGPAIDSRA